ncbi:hypothetical protein BX667DRAFT_516592 [Coemansia mojavensis]|nr:hypothetical protein BX667DRAFT_516592 [Coemansia mojavensis]
MHCSFSAASIAAAAAVGLATATQAYPAPHMHARSFVGYSGLYPYGGYGFGFPFASSFTNAFNANSNFAHFNDDTLYVNDKDATVANNNVNSFNNAKIIA